MSFFKSFKEFDVSFIFSQRIHSLRKKLNHARCILENTRNTLASIRLHSQKMTQMSRFSIRLTEFFQFKLENIFSELCNHFSITCKLLRISEDIRFMIIFFLSMHKLIRLIDQKHDHWSLNKYFQNNDILRFRDQRRLYDNELDLTRIDQTNALEKKIMLYFANRIVRDFRIVRIVTVIAMFYLSTNLIMISFFRLQILYITVWAFSSWDLYLFLIILDSL
jgi:hypothetical protein